MSSKFYRQDPLLFFSLHEKNLDSPRGVVRSDRVFTPQGSVTKAFCNSVHVYGHCLDAAPCTCAQASGAWFPYLETSGQGGGGLVRGGEAARPDAPWAVPAAAAAPAQ